MSVPEQIDPRRLSTHLQRDLGVTDGRDLGPRCDDLTGL